MKKSKLNAPIIILAVLIVLAAGLLVFCIFQGNKVLEGNGKPVVESTTAVAATQDTPATLIQATEAPVE